MAGIVRSSNPQINKLLQAMHGSHDPFHAGIAQIKELLQQRDRSGAEKIFRTVVVPGARQTFERFDLLLAEAAIYYEPKV